MNPLEELLEPNRLAATCDPRCLQILVTVLGDIRWELDRQHGYADPELARRIATLWQGVDDDRTLAGLSVLLRLVCVFIGDAVAGWVAGEMPQQDAVALIEPWLDVVEDWRRRWRRGARGE